MSIRATISESGQSLVVFTLLLGIFVFMAMAVLDVGLLLQERQATQNAADAAALAGAQELPASADAAKAAALDYIVKNGIAADDVDISFTCTVHMDELCNEAAGRYDTIVVTPRSQAQSFFGGILGVIGIDSCWVDGCFVEASAAGCRGACGPIGKPVDAVMVIDRSGSMTAADMTGAKDAANSLLGFFDDDWHRIGLGVLGPSSTSTTCSGAYAGGLGINAASGGTWLPVPLTSDFQNSDGSVNTSSQLYKTINCLTTSSVGTNIGQPLEAAVDHLVADGRSGATHGIILLSDGAANRMPYQTNNVSTGQRFCTNQSAVTSNAGDNNGFQTNASLACADGGGNASDSNSGTSTSTTCTSTAKDKHNFRDFDLSSAITGTTVGITGIEVRLDAWTNGTAATRRMCVQLSWDGGFTWTTTQQVDLTNSEATYILGSPTNDWGRAWATNDFSNANFRVRVMNVASNTSTTFSLDAVAVNVHYTTQTSLYAGPCAYAKEIADQAIAAGIELYVVAWGATGDSCSSENAGSAFAGMPADDFLRDLVVDDAHFFNEPKSTDLEPVFKAIGAQLAAGSKLVPIPQN